MNRPRHARALLSAILLAVAACTVTLINVVEMSGPAVDGTGDGTGDGIGVSQTQVTGWGGLDVVIEQGDDEGEDDEGEGR